MNVTIFHRIKWKERDKYQYFAKELRKLRNMMLIIISRIIAVFFLTIPEKVWKINIKLKLDRIVRISNNGDEKSLVVT